MEAEAREMSRLTVKAANMSRRTAVAVERSRRAAEASRRSRRAVDAADWCGRAAEVEEMSRRAANAAEMSSRTAAAWENVSRAGEDSYRRMHAIVLSQMDQISGWASLQDDMKASFEQATGVIRQLREGNEKLWAERDLLRVKIVGSAEQQEETTALLKRTGVIIQKLMHENAMLRVGRQRLVEESVDALKQHLEDKSSLPLAAETSSRGLQQRIKKVEISEPDRCLPSSFALVYFGCCRIWLF